MTSDTALTLWAPPIFAFGPEPPPERRLTVAARRLDRLRSAANASADWVAMPRALLEIARQLHENDFSVVDGLLGRELAEAVRTQVATHEAWAGGVAGRIAGGAGGARGAAVTALRSDVSVWVPAGSSDSALDRLAERLDRLVARLRDSDFTSVVDGGAAASTSAHLAHVRARGAEAMLAHYPAGGARYVRHDDNVCAGGEGAQCNGRRLTAVYYLTEPHRDGEPPRLPSEYGHGTFSPGALRIFARGPPGSAARADIAPTLDRAVLFWADERAPHAVLPTGPTRGRLAVTFWYFCAAELGRVALAAPASARAQQPALRAI